MDSVFLRYDRTAKSNRAEPRRDSAGAIEAATLPYGLSCRGAGIFLHHNRLDDVEFSGEHAIERSLPRVIRRESGLPHSGCAMEGGAGFAREFFWCESRVCGRDGQGRYRATREVRFVAS